MKKILFIFLATLGVLNLLGQTPYQINYQGIARNSLGNVLPNQNISLRLSILDGSATGNLLYQEVRELKTNYFGMFNVAIGSSGTTNQIGTLSTVNWNAGGAKFLQVEMDLNGGSNFVKMGASQLQSVPYAFVAGQASPSGPAGGALSGTFPNPDLANGAVTNSKIADGSITNSKVAANAIDYSKLADNAVTTTKITDASVTAAKLAPGVIPTSLTPSGTAGGDLTGTYPNPTIKDGAIITTKVADGAISANKIADNAIGNSKLADNAVTTTKITDASVTAAKLAPGVIPTSLTPSGVAGGDLSGTYPNPTVAANAIDNTKLADNAVTTAKITDASVTAAKLAPGVIPTSLTPSGAAGGDLSGAYPNPSVASIRGTTISNTAPVTGQVLKFDGTQWTPAAESAGAAGTAGGDLTGTYPNPTVAANAIDNTKLADNAVTTTKITDASVTAAKLAPGVIPTSLTPSGTAGGDLAGSYPNPSVAQIRGTAISSTAPSSGQALIFNGTQWAPATISASASGTAGGDLTGNYPNPTVAANAIDNSKLADNAVTTTKITDASVTAAKLAPGVIPTSLTPSGTAGGDLAGTYPNPSVAANAIDNNKLADNAVTTTKITDASVTAAKLAPGVIPTSLTPSGTAGGDLTGNYPNPTVAANAIDNSKLADNAVTTTKITDASVTAAKLAPGVIPTSLTPSGTAGGDLAGSYPNPSVASIRGTTISNTAPAAGQVLKFDGTQWTPAAESAGASGTAGGDLTGTYPNPTVAANAIDNTKLADNAVTTTKITDASVTAAKLAPGVIPTSLTPSGTAGGDLAGSYPNPTVAANAIDNTKLADNAVTTTKITDASVTAAKLAPGVIPTSLTPSGTAGGDLAGSYPTPSVAKIQGTAVSNTAPSSGQVLTFNGTQWVPANITSGGSTPTGSAGGDLSGNYPNPNIASGAITTSKIANGSIVTPKLVDGAVTTNKIADGAVTAAKLAPGLIPSSLPPSGAAGGDLAGSYPNPSVASIRGNTISNTTPTAGQVLKFDGTQWTPAAESAGTSGTAGGDLTGTYPNPTVAANAINNTKLADNAVTTTKITDASVTAAKLAPGVIPTSLTPSGTAGGDLAGSYPNPSVAQIRGTAISSTAPSSGQALIFNGTQWAPAAISASASGTAGGDLTGTYPNPTVAANAINNSKLADNAVTTSKITDASVTAAKLAPGVIPSSLTPSGTAGGDLSGSYPNPTVASIRGNSISSTAPSSGQVLTFNGSQWVPAAISTSASGIAGGDLAGTYPNPSVAASAIDNTKLADNAVTTTKITDASVTAAKLAPGVIPTSLTPSGTAGGDLSGTYPNPTVAANAIDNTKLADNAVTTTKINDASVTAAKLAPGVIPTSLTPSGTAGGDLAGSYPNPSVAQIRGTAISSTAPSSGQALIFNGTQWAPATISASASGTAGGDLTGTYPNPTVAANAIDNTKLADNAVTTTKITDASVTAAKLAPGVIPTSLTPSGTAGGDLGGTYPNPTVTQIQGTAVSNTTPASGQVLKFDGTQWAPAAEAAGGGSLTLPYTASQAAASSLFSITNSGAGNALEGTNSSTNAGAYGIEGKITSTSPGNGSAGIKGTNSGTGTNSYGVWGSHAGSGYGVYGSSVNGYGVYATSNNTGLFATTTGNSSNAGFFDISNASNGSDALYSSTTGMGNGIVGVTSGNSVFTAGVVGYSNYSSGIGLIGLNGLDGEGVRGMTYSSVAAAVVGENDGTFAGVYGYNTATGGTGVLAEAPANSSTPGNALVANITGTGNGNPAVFRVNGSNVARIDQTGKGFFNGGAVTGGADVAEYFDVEGSKAGYEPGDVLVISQNSDRTVEKSTGAYSTLVAGVYATKPGVLLTEKNAEENHLQDMVPMGVIGVIPTKVCLEGGAIKRGDLIVTSSQPGVAMKADPDKVKIGQVIGKALQDYNGSGVGMIKVLVSIK